MEGGEVLLPPDVLLVLGSHGGDHVVEVHDDVDESVEEGEECRVAARGELQAHPDGEGHDSMVNDVERRDVLVLLTQDEEQLQQLGLITLIRFRDEVLVGFGLRILLAWTGLVYIREFSRGFTT